jgi:hypothetical protein
MREFVPTQRGFAAAMERESERVEPKIARISGGGIYGHF